jgi:hypothetical protein
VQRFVCRPDWLQSKEIGLYNERIRYIRNNDPQSAYAAHILNNVHEYGKISTNMSLLKQVDKGPSRNSYEQFFI